MTVDLCTGQRNRQHTLVPIMTDFADKVAEVIVDAREANYSFVRWRANVQRLRGDTVARQTVKDGLPG